MKQIISNIQKLGLLAVLLAGLVACEKDKELTKAISIEIKGFNIGNAELEVSVDTLAYRTLRTKPNSELNFASIFTYPAGTNEVSLKIKDLTSGKEVYQQQLTLKSSELEFFFPFVLIDGLPLEIKPPAADTATNKLGFYIYYPQSTDPIDVVMKNDEGQIAYLAKNVLPGTWVYSNYMASVGFQDASKDYPVFYVKAGTTDAWAFQDSEWMSKGNDNSMALPQKDVKGRVCSYFVTPGTVDLRVVRLFKQPK